MRPVHVITAIMLLFIQATAYGDDDSVRTTKVKVGEAAPDFSCRTLTGEDFSLSGQKGKVVLVSFFSTKCNYCLIEMPFLEKEVYQKFSDRDVFELIAIGRGQNAPELEPVKKGQHLSFPMAPDPEREIYGLFAEKYIPRQFIVGKDGRIKSISAGYTDSTIQEIVQAIQNALEE